MSDNSSTARGYAFKYGDNVDTDVIIPARYLNASEASHLAAHCMEDIDPDFINKVAPGDIIVGGGNFGCGSSREHAPLAIAACGVSCVIAKSFARIFYRNAINIGLPILECDDADSIKTGDLIEINFSTGTITNQTRGDVYKTQPYPEFMRRIIEVGGLINYIAINAMGNEK
ncbi:MAG: 3-isopropylmalate dehydratase small subunit [Clostridiales bacterium]|jgi:3-isopropylmalate/(R)-2-methylmalate dehydratase small subunit|nr:3-isopropylmalate dehydratase small subunit [Clostridiales bacterium]